MKVKQQALQTQLKEKNTMPSQQIYHLQQEKKQYASDTITVKQRSLHYEQRAIQLRLNLENAQGRITELETAAKKAENALAKASHDNLFLTQEKTELATQLKQWQTRQGQETVA